MALKNMLCTLLFALPLPAAFAQDAEEEYPLTDISKLVRPGTKLIYDVEANGMKYNFIVTMKDKAGASFDWEMTAPVNTKGSITHTKKGMQQGIYLHNFFSAGAKTLDDKTTSVWLSQAMLSGLQKAKPFLVYPNGKGSEAVEMSTYTGAIPFEILLDGNKAWVECELAHKMVKSPYGEELTPGGDESLNFIADKNFPLILRMQLGFWIMLKEVRTK